MRTFIGLSFTWLPNRVRPDQVLVPFVPTLATFTFYVITSTSICIQNPYAIHAPLILMQSMLPCAPLFVIVIAIIIAIAVIITIIIVVIASFVAKIVAYRSLLLLLLFV
jgi:hypothetical protein